MTEDVRQKILPIFDSLTADVQSAKSVISYSEQNQGADGASDVKTPAVSIASGDGKPAVLAISDDKGPKLQGAEKQPSAVRQDIGQKSELTPKPATFDPSRLAKNDFLQAEPKNLIVSGEDRGAQAVDGLVTMGKADPQNTGLHRPQTPLLAQHVAQQLSVSVRQASDRTTEIALDPVELGRVQMQIKATDQSIVLTIMADRPETVDLMRRNIDILNHEFKTLGYTSVTLNFSSGQDNAGFGMSGETGSDNHAGSGEAELTSIFDAVDAAPADPLRNADGSLDLRW
ncbi:flagellar hook-length control protein FliK [Loktanella salsilacus]|uniref:flagellar hook-length control protein FliK n=1 Tax=Loktanella salsilacus TaxID=195913 RepID=UPI0037369CBC